MSTPTPFTALILAGQRRANDPVAKAGGKACKAFVDIHGKPMIIHVLETLRACEAIDSIFISLDETLPYKDECPELIKLLGQDNIHLIKPQESPSASVHHLLETRLLNNLVITTADHPLLTPAMLIQFIESFLKSGADAAAAVTPTDMIEQCYPQCKRTKIKFSDGSYTGCNLFGMKGANGKTISAFWQKIDSLRKTPWKIFSVIGIGTFAKYISGTLSLRGAVQDLADKVDAHLSPIILLDPHAGIDVDSVEDLDLVRQIMQDNKDMREAAQKTRQG